MKDAHTTGEASALKREHPEIPKITLLHFLFLFLKDVFVHLDPDPAEKNQCRFRSGSTTLGERFNDVKFITDRWSVLQIRDVYLGSWIRIFSIPDPGSRIRIKDFKYGF
jgi:hypothetical protein